MAVGAAGATHPVSHNTISAKGSLLFLNFIPCRIKLKSLDTIMHSPPPPSRLELEGASRTHGGIFRGRALGNQPNLAVMSTTPDTMIPYPSKIHLHVTGSTNPADWGIQSMSHQVLKHPVTTSLKVILQYISERHSPVQSESIRYIYIILRILSLIRTQLSYLYI